MGSEQLHRPVKGLIAPLHPALKPVLRQDKERIPAHKRRPQRLIELGNIVPISLLHLPLQLTQRGGNRSTRPGRRQIAELIGIGRQAVQFQELPPIGDQGRHAPPGWWGHPLESTRLAVIGPAQGIKRLIKKPFHMFPVEGGFVHQECRNHPLIRGIHGGLGATRQQKQERIDHRHRAGNQRRIHQTDDHPGLPVATAYG